MRTLAVALLTLVSPLALLGGCNRPPASPAAARPTATTAIRFVDAAKELGLSYQFTPGGSPPLNILKVTTGAGVGFLDFDGDGWQDVLCLSLPRPGLFRNEDGRRFKDVTARSGLARVDARWNGCATGDFDNDGRVDLFLTACDRVALFRNNGDGSFKDVTASAGVQLNRWATSAAFADVNEDGRLDLYVGCYVQFGPGMPEWMNIRGVRLPLSPMAYDGQKGVLFLNTGNGKFRDVTRESGLSAASGKALGVAFADADDDGDEDLYIANDEEPQDFFINDGRGRFHNAAVENGTAFNGEGGRQGGMGVDFGDYDGDGRLDIFVGTFSDELKSLYHNLGGGVYEHAAISSQIAQSTRPWVAFGTKLTDLDNDGRLDLIIINGHVRDLVRQVDPANSYAQKSQLFINAGGGRFNDVSEAVGPDFRKPIVGRGLAIGDFDNDGDVDALAADLQGPPVLLRNEGGHAAGNWLALELTGKRSNRMGIGARITLTAGGVRQIRELRTDGSFLAAHDPRVRFGLGKTAKADEIQIRWPSGREQTLKDVAANQSVQVTEP